MIKTLFIDIDGTLLKHRGSLLGCINDEPELLPGVLERLEEWKMKEYRIILTTARTESMREKTIQQLEKVDIFYDMLIMGIPHGPRYVINDNKPHMKKTAYGITIKRNEGFNDLII